MRQVPNLIFLAGLLGTSPILSAQVGQAIEIPLRPSEPDYYAWITQLSIGQTAWSRKGLRRGTALSGSCSDV